MTIRGTMSYLVKAVTNEGFNMDVEFEEFNEWLDDNVVKADIPQEEDDPEGFKFFEFQCVFVW